MLIENPAVPGFGVVVARSDAWDAADLLTAGNLLGVSTDNDDPAVFAVREPGDGLRKADLAAKRGEVVLLGFRIEPVPFRLPDE